MTRQLCALCFHMFFFQYFEWMCLFRATYILCTGHSTEFEGVAVSYGRGQTWFFFSYSSKESFNPTCGSSLLFAHLSQPDRNTMKPFPPLAESLHSLTNRLKVDVSASSRMLHELRRLEGKQLSKIKGKRGKWMLALSLQTQCKNSIFLPRCSSVTTIAVWTKATFSALPHEMVIGCIRTIERMIAKEQEHDCGRQ